MAKEPTNRCLSGDGRLCHGTFAPGGDAKYKSQLIDRVLSGDPKPEESKVAEKELKALGYGEEFIRTQSARTISAKRAEEILKERKWDKFLTAKREANARRAAKAADRAKAAADKIDAAKAENTRKETAATAAAS